MQYEKDGNILFVLKKNKFSVLRAMYVEFLNDHNPKDLEQVLCLFHTPSTWYYAIGVK